MFSDEIIDVLEEGKLPDNELDFFHSSAGSQIQLSSNDTKISSIISLQENTLESISADTANSTITEANEHPSTKQQGKRLADESGETHSVKRQKTDTLSEESDIKNEKDNTKQSVPSSQISESTSKSNNNSNNNNENDDRNMTTSPQSSDVSSSKVSKSNQFENEDFQTDEYDAVIDSYGQIQILENHPFDKKKAACCFCYETGDRKKQGELLCLGRLILLRGSTKKLYWAHENCLYMSSRKVKTTEGDQAQLESDMELLRRLCFSTKCKLLTCGKPRATIGCTINTCKNVYHYHCAYQSGGEFLITSTLTRFYCPRHLSIGILEKMKCVRWPADCGIRYIARNSWHKIEDSYKNAIYQNKFHWEKFDTEWFRQDLSPRIYIRRIYPGHWAWSDELEQRGKTDPKYAKQYEAVAASDIEPSEVIGEYVGIVKRTTDGGNSKYLADFYFPDTLPTSLLIDPICVDAEEWANETRFINSVTPSTPPFIEQNATMSTLWCRGELRILILSTKRIPAHTPIVLNYNEFSSSYFEEVSSPRKTSKCYVWVPIKDQGKLSKEMMNEMKKYAKEKEEKGKENEQATRSAESSPVKRIIPPKQNLIPRSPSKFVKQQRVSNSVRQTSDSDFIQHEFKQLENEDEITNSNEKLQLGQKSEQLNASVSTSTTNSLHTNFTKPSVESTSATQSSNPNTSLKVQTPPLSSSTTPSLQETTKQNASNSPSQKNTKSSDTNAKNRNKLKKLNPKIMNTININVKNQKHRKGSSKPPSTSETTTTTTTTNTNTNTATNTNTNPPESGYVFSSQFSSSSSSFLNPTTQSTSNLNVTLSTAQVSYTRPRTDQYEIAAAQKEIDFFAE